MGGEVERWDGVCLTDGNKMEFEGFALVMTEMMNDLVRVLWLGFDGMVPRGWLVGSDDMVFGWASICGWLRRSCHGSRRNDV